MSQVADALEKIYKPSNCNVRLMKLQPREPGISATIGAIV